MSPELSTEKKGVRSTMKLPLLRMAFTFALFFTVASSAQAAVLVQQSVRSGVSQVQGSGQYFMQSVITAPSTSHVSAIVVWPDSESGCLQLIGIVRHNNQDAGGSVYGNNTISYNVVQDDGSCLLINTQTGDNDGGEYFNSGDDLYLLVVDTAGTNYLQGSVADTVPSTARHYNYSTTGLLNDANVQDYAFALCSTLSSCQTDEYTEEPENLNTRIVSVEPYATTTATTTTVSFEAYINPDDYVEGMSVVVSFFNPTIGATSANVIDSCNVFGAGLCSYTFPITASTTVASSTTITFNYGGTTKATWTIRKPNAWSSLWVVGGLFQETVLYTFKSSFVVGFQTLFDQSLNGDGTQIDSDSSGLVGYFTTGGTSSTTVAAVGCANIFTGGTITQCLTSLILPDGATLAYDFKLLYDGAFSKVPFGYATRFLTIMSGNAGAVEPPAISYTFGSSSPAVLQGKNWTIQPWEHFDIVGSAKADDGSNKNIWDITMPYFNVLIALVVLLACLSDLFGFELRHDRSEETEESYGALTPSEKALANRAQYQSEHGGGTVKR